MPSRSTRPDFSDFQVTLLRAGVSPRHVRRAIIELNEHYDDLVEDSLRSDTDARTAEQCALRALGDLRCIEAEMCSIPELRCWAFRYPRVALFVYPLLCLALLPAVPVIAGVAHAPQLARWATCMFLSALVTAGMLLFMQLSITLT